ncbi:MAG: hypothetical protein PVF49_02805 [Anaerolineales bacterium]|jgi:hypothetical protein
MNHRRVTLTGIKKPAIVWFCLAIAGVVVIRWFTQNGISLWEDSFDYITAASSLAEGRGYGRLDGYGAFRPLTHFPPAYPLLLAGLEIIGVGIYDGARWLNAVLFGLLIFGSGWLVYRLTRSAAWSIAAAGLVLVSETLIYAHLWALTEPLYLALTVTCLIALGSYISRPNRRAPLLIGAAAASLALLTRYAGIATTMAGAAALIVLAYRPLRRRLLDAGLFLGIAAAPAALFLLRNLSLAGTVTDDPSPTWQPPLRDEWVETLRIVLSWFLPDVVMERLDSGAIIMIAIVSLVLLIALLAWVFRLRQTADRSGDKDTWPFLWILMFYLLAYLLVYPGALFWMERLFPADERLLTPILWALLLLVPGLMGVAWRRSQRLPRILLLAAFGALVTVQLLRAWGLPSIYSRMSLGFASDRWRESETIAAINQFPNVLIYSNEIQSIYFLADRNAIFVPTPYNPATLVTRSDYPAALEQMRDNMREQDARLVLFQPWALDDTYLQQLTAGLLLGGDFDDGQWYYWPQ